MKIHAKTLIGQVEAANVRLPMLAPKEWESYKSEIDLTEEKEESLKKIDLSGIQDWSLGDQNAAKALLIEFFCIFSRTDLDLGTASIVKYKSKDEIPFRKRYRCIPPGMYEEVKAHLQEILNLVSIRPLPSPWASVVLLVRKKDRKLRFCTDLHKLNEWTVNGSYSLPHTDETPNFLNGAEQFTSLTWSQVTDRLKIKWK